MSLSNLGYRFLDSDLVIQEKEGKLLHTIIEEKGSDGFLVVENNTYTLNQRIGAIKSKVFIPEFLVYQFNRNKYLLSFNNGENQTNLRKGDILKCPLWIPSKEVQQTIVRQLDALRAETQKLEAVYQQKIADLEELKKSILQKAFAGELKMSEPLINAD